MKFLLIALGRIDRRVVFSGFLLGVVLLSISACSTVTPAPATGATSAPAPTVLARIVTKIQAVYAELKADAAVWILAHATDAPAVAEVESVLDPEIAALSSDTLPISVSAVLGDINNQLQALPTGLISANTKTDLNDLFAIAQMASLFVQATPHAPVQAVSGPAFDHRHFVRI